MKKTTNNHRLIGNCTALTLVMLMALPGFNNWETGHPHGEFASAKLQKLNGRPNLATLPYIEGSRPDQFSGARMGNLYARLPLSFESNKGQADPRVEFLARGNGYNLLLTGNEAVLVLGRNRTNIMSKEPESSVPGLSPSQPSDARSVLRMKLVGAKHTARAEGESRTLTSTNYLIGDDPAKWITEVPSFTKVRYSGVYEGVDLLYYGNQRQLEYDFVIGAGADPNPIRLEFQGADRLEVDYQGNLVLHVADGKLRQHKPIAYQEAGGKKQEIPCNYVLSGDRQVEFQLGHYDTSRPLVIDPILVYSTFAGGNDVFGDTDAPGDTGMAIAVDSNGNAYITGQTASTDFPGPSPIQGGYGGGLGDAFVLKLNSTGTAAIYSTYLGGNRRDTGVGIDIDEAGNAYITGVTRSDDFPTVNPVQPALLGSDAFVAKLTPSGTGLIYSTYLGGSDFDTGWGIEADSTGNAYVTGETFSPDFPSTPGAFRSAGFTRGAFVTKLGPSGDSLIYSALLAGGESFAIAIDSAGNAYIAGEAFTPDYPTTPSAFLPVVAGGAFSYSFATKLNQAGSELVYSTFLDANGNDRALSVAVDRLGNAYVVGLTPNPPTTPAAAVTSLGPGGNEDGFVKKLNPTGSALIYSTNLGGSAFDWVTDIAVDPVGNAYLVGVTDSGDFPTLNTLQAVANFFVAKLNRTGDAFVYSTYFGSPNLLTDFFNLEFASSIAIDARGDAYITGYTIEEDFPTTPGAFQTVLNAVTDAFISKIASADVCLQDDGGSLRFDTVTGSYELNDCRTSLQLTGTGKISKRGCVTMLEDNRNGVRLQAQFNSCQLKGNVVAKGPSWRGAFVITDKDTTDNNCVCP